MFQFHQVGARHKLQKARPFLYIFQNFIYYKTTGLFEVYALRRVREIGPESFSSENLFRQISVIRFSNYLHRFFVERIVGMIVLNYHFVEEDCFSSY